MRNLYFVVVVATKSSDPMINDFTNRVWKELDNTLIWDDFAGHIPGTIDYLKESLEQKYKRVLEVKLNYFAVKNEYGVLCPGAICSIAEGCKNTEVFRVGSTAVRKWEKIVEPSKTMDSALKIIERVKHMVECSSVSAEEIVSSNFDVTEPVDKAALLEVVKLIQKEISKKSRN